MQFQRPFANGFNFTVGYNYNRERNEEFFDNQDFYLRNPTYQPARNARHRITGAAIYEIPFGKGRRFMSGAPKALDYAFGGWSIAPLFTYNTGLFLRFGTVVVNGDPTVETPTRDRWFDTSKFTVQPAFTRRTNPFQYPKLVGPNTLNLDLTLAKEFRVTEKVKFELRMEGYNMANSFFASDPDLNVTSPNFGRVVTQRGGFFGRQLQYTGRIIF